MKKHAYVPGDMLEGCILYVSGRRMKNGGANAVVIFPGFAGEVKLAPWGIRHYHDPSLAPRQTTFCRVGDGDAIFTSRPRKDGTRQYILQFTRKAKDLTALHAQLREEST